MIRITKPKFGKTQRYLEKLEDYDPKALLEDIGRIGVQALSDNTPVDSGKTAQSWSYRVEGRGESYKVIWTNTEMAGRAPLVLLLQYGHATKSGFFLSGRDFINPALKPVYETFLKRLGQEVTS